LELLSVVDDNLDAKHALAFGINLQSQLATVQLEYRQIVPMHAIHGRFLKIITTEMYG
jgi:hypothetical protein